MILRMMRTERTASWTYLCLAWSHHTGNSQTLQHSVAVSQDPLELVSLLSLGRHVSVGAGPPHLLVPGSHGGFLDVGTGSVQHHHREDVQAEQTVDPEEEIPEVRPLDVIRQTRSRVAADHPTFTDRVRLTVIVTQILPARSTARVEPRREWREILSSQGPAMCQTSFTPITSVKHLKTLQLS